MSIEELRRSQFKKLQEIFPEIPDGCISLTIKLGLKESTVIECKFYPAIPELMEEKNT